MRIAAVCGSLQENSSNGLVLTTAQKVAPAGTDVVIFQSLGEVPGFNPDAEVVPEAVAELRALLGSADGVLISAPEYAHGLAGVLKNALDWIVGSGELYGKRVAIVAGAPSEERGLNARADLERTLRAQGATVVSSVTIAVRRLEPDALAQAVRASLDTL